eukprot:COSAG05_NODE_22879_length_261_cov_1.654321_1_plen_34_part_01
MRFGALTKRWGFPGGAAAVSVVLGSDGPRSSRSA